MPSYKALMMVPREQINKQHPLSPAAAIHSLCAGARAQPARRPCG
jgi:hypothetical protein